MKKVILVSWLLLVSVLTTKAQQTEFPKLSGPYFGQMPPGNNPKIFFPEVIVKQKMAHSNIVFTSDGLYAFWCYDGIRFSKVENGSWTTPELLPFSKKEYEDDSPFISPDDKKLFFTSKRSVTEHDTSKTENVWQVEINKGQWSEPHILPSIVNDPFFHWQVSVDNEGTIYFTKYEFEINIKPDHIPNRDLWFCEWNGRKYLPPKICSNMINTDHGELHPYISPDGSYLIFSRMNNKRLDDGRQDFSLYISFKKKNKTWTEAVSLSKYVKYKYVALCPIVTRDGKYLFFLDMDKQSGCYQRYWISAEFIEKLRPKD